MGVLKFYQPLHELLRVLGLVLAAHRVDGEVEELCGLQGRRQPVGQLPLDGNRLKVHGGFVEDEVGILGHDGHQGDGGVVRQVPEGQSGTVVDHLAPAIADDIYVGFTFVVFKDCIEGTYLLPRVGDVGTSSNEFQSPYKFRPI
jgi:hypothetical protein